MAEDRVNAQIREFIMEKFPLAKRHHLKDSDALLETGIVDSLGVLDVVAYLEQEFSIGVADDELVPENFQSIEKLSAFVRRKCATGQ